MELLWAPWRMPYVRKVGREKGPGKCFLCDYARRPSKDRENLVLLRGPSCFMVMNLYPYASGHLMVAPLAHKADLALLDGRERAELLDLTVRGQAALGKAIEPHGFNLGINVGRAAGAGVPGHVHLHIVPRWTGDTNFMVAVGRTRVLPMGLAPLYARLQKALRKGR
jgi:ATP adenylyltransferase